MPTTLRDIPFFNYRGAFASLEPELTDTIKDVISRGAFIMQKDLTEFEAAIAQYMGVKHAFGVGNATDGLVYGLKAAGFTGGEVILPAHTMIATPSSVVFAGGTPVPVDIRADHMIDPAAIEAAITPKTRAIMPVQLNGRTCEMDTIMALAKKHDLLVVEDAAQALGSTFNGKMAGTFGLASSISYYPAKVLGCIGDGGMIIATDDAVADKVHQLRDHGRDRNGDVVSWGMNSRLDNIQAAILHLQFRTYAQTIAHRRDIAQAYQDALGDVPEVALPPAPDADPRHFDVYQNYEAEFDKRDALKDHLKAHGVGTLIQWGGKAVHQHEKLGLKAHAPVTERFFTRCLMLPMNLMVTRDDVSYIADVVRGFYGR
jgi:dTDP-4-amino-4,6-dideoxygalactose transaminase